MFLRKVWSGVTRRNVLIGLQNKSEPFLPLAKVRLCSSAAAPNVAQHSDEFAGLSLSDEKVQKFIQNLTQEYDELNRTEIRSRAGHRRLAALQPLVNCSTKRAVVLDSLKQLEEEMKDEKDKDLLNMIKDEKEDYAKYIGELDEQMMQVIFSMNDEETCSTVIFEVTTGVGGQEAMLFANELYEMYLGYFEHKGWEVDIIQVDTSELGGIRHASAIVTGEDAFNFLKYEAGVHRVQRIPSTEKAGRVHTSTVSIAAIPKPDDLDFNIKPNDLKIETKRASGAGGQHVNTTDSAVRIVHLPTGVAVECQTQRSQIKNKEMALKKLQARLCEEHMNKQLSTQMATRKTQVGTSMRNEKIRTYNYNQDRITDHRLTSGGTLHNLTGFLEGTDSLDGLITKLRNAQRKEEIVAMIESIK